MKAVTIKSLQVVTHPETKKLFWFMFAGTRGGMNRIKILQHLQRNPTNTHKLSQEVGIDYKGVQHHLKVLSQNNLVTKVGSNYGGVYFPSELFEGSKAVFDEIVTRLSMENHNAY